MRVVSSAVSGSRSGVKPFACVLSVREMLRVWCDAARRLGDALPIRCRRF